MKTGTNYLKGSLHITRPQILNRTLDLKWFVKNEIWTFPISGTWCPTAWGQLQKRPVIFLNIGMESLLQECTSWKTLMGDSWKPKPHSVLRVTAKTLNWTYKLATIAMIIAYKLQQYSNALPRKIQRFGRIISKSQKWLKGTHKHTMWYLIYIWMSNLMYQTKQLPQA